MSFISAAVTLRPIRFGFLVKPTDKKKLHEIFRINTCLWGGQFNPIIPIIKQVPKWWDRRGVNFDSAAQIVNGYLDAFEPDFIVETVPGLANGLDFDSERVLQLSEILPKFGDRAHSGYGLSVFDLYRHLYTTEFQFVRRDEHNIVDVIPQSKEFDIFCSCAFGSFPTNNGLKYFSEGFSDAFAPKHIDLAPDSFTNLFRSGFTSALKIGRSKLEVDYHSHSDPIIFVLNATDPRDLIDFWNLRIFYRDVLPIPTQWLESISPFCRDLIKLNHRPLPGNPNGVMIRATVMFSRSIPTADIEPLYNAHLRVDQDGANVLQVWYPQIWRPSPGFVLRQTRSTLTAGEKNFDTNIVRDESDIRFDSIDPDFAERYGGGHARWANVVKLEDWSGKDQFATVFPCNYKNPKTPKLGTINRSVIPTTEGLVCFSKYKGMPNSWTLEDGTTAIRKWLKLNNIDAELSDAGRSTQQVIQTLGGFSGVGNFSHADIVKLLNKVSRSPISPSIQHQKFKNHIDNAVDGDVWKSNSFEGLVKRGAVQLGLELKCTKCGSWSWHSISNLDNEVTCSLCLRQFGFPNVDPSSKQNSQWSYRLVGPFSLPDYAKGGYAASLTIRFFARILGGTDTGLTWSAGQELRLAPSDRVEADLILWHQRKSSFGLDHQTELVFGEAKSFRGESADERRSIKDAFEADDVDRMERLASRFPGAILVFATMKQANDLSSGEIDRIAKLAKWGREYIREKRQTRAPVIVLTGTELFASFSLAQAWQAVGGRHAEFAQGMVGRMDSLRGLADLTQQLYLGMPSYSDWVQSKIERRWQKRQRPPAAANVG